MVALAFLVVFCLVVAVWATPWYIWGTALFVAVAFAFLIHVMKQA